MSFYEKYAFSLAKRALDRLSFAMLRAAGSSMICTVISCPIILSNA